MKNMSGEWEILNFFFQALGKWTNLSAQLQCSLKWMKICQSELPLWVSVGEKAFRSLRCYHWWANPQIIKKLIFICCPALSIHRCQSWLCNKDLVLLDNGNARFHLTKSSNITLEHTQFESELYIQFILPPWVSKQRESQHAAVYSTMFKVWFIQVHGTFS